MFTGDRSGDWLLRAMHMTGFCNQVTSTGIGDGLEMIDSYVTSIVKCAPPENRPTGQERANCRVWLNQELSFRPPIIVTLGGMAFAETLRALRDGGETIPVPRPSFGHGETLSLERSTILACYHPSQLNTSTGRLTESMLLAVFSEARHLVDDLEYPLHKVPETP
jgi:uracil-DNA glycosylase family 4